MLLLSPLFLALLAAPQQVAGPAIPDSTLQEARSAVSRGLPWRASLLLAPVIRDSAARTPETLLLAATAASGWNGWAQVHELLTGAPWLDSAFAGTGRALLARAALERDENAAAARHAVLAIAAAPSDRIRGERLVLRARALDRLDSLAAAAEAYAGAARLLPEISDWLHYRAAVVTADSAARQAMFALVTAAPARGRIRSAEAEALRRAGRGEAAASAYAALGAYGDAYRLRLKAATTDSARESLRAELVEILRTREHTPQARAASAALDAGFAPLDPATELLVGRVLTQGGGSHQRAADGFRRAFAAGLGTARDRYDYARHLFALGRYEEAARQFKRVGAPRALAASAAYEGARALVRAGQTDAARAALRRVGTAFPQETEPAASALYLLADLATDEQRDAAARGAFRSLVTRYPRARLAPAAGFHAAVIAYSGGAHQVAAREFDSLVTRYPASPEATAARYWAGRAWAEAGDSAAARTRWQAVRDRDRDGYYGALSSRRLDLPAWMPAEAVDTFIAVPEVDAALARAAFLDQLGLGREARWEEEGAVRGADSSVERLLATAHAFRERDMASRAMRLAARALGKGAAADARTYRLLYPLVHREPLLGEARRHDVEPMFAAALIRQESNFTPTATSPAGARGLMQIMPEVGRAVARSQRFPVWDPVLLYQPDVNLQLGMAHLRELVNRYPGAPARILAAYNAGGSRVERWTAKRGTADAEVFSERIPYPETRDYVRIIQRNQDFYRALYP